MILREFLTIYHRFGATALKRINLPDSCTSPILLRTSRNSWCLGGGTPDQARVSGSRSLVGCGRGGTVERLVSDIVALRAICRVFRRAPTWHTALAAIAPSR